MAGIRLKFGAALAAATALVPAGAAYAQAQGPTREQVNPPAPQADPRTSTAQVESQAVGSGPCPLADSDVKVAIKELRFTAYGGGPLAPELQQLLTGIATGSEEQSVAVVCRLRDEAIARLRAARYVASVQIPAQRIGDGALRLEVVTGRITEVRVRGEPGPFEGLLRRRIEALKALDPLNERDAERILLLADDEPGLDVKLGLSPSGTKPGELIGDLTVDYHRVGLIANVQNYNSELLGRETVYVKADYYGLTGMGDVTYIAGALTPLDPEEQRIVQIGHAFSVDGGPTRISMVGTYAESRPDLAAATGGGTAAIDLRTKTWIGELDVSHSLVRTLSTLITATLGFEYSNQTTKVFSTTGPVPLNRDRISTVFLRGEGNYRQRRLDGSQKLYLGAGLEVRKGLGLFGATPVGTVTDGFSPSRFEGDSQAFVARGNFQAVVGLGPIFELMASGRGQWADKPLLNYDEFSIGNLTVGRGYDPGANTGDRAVGGTLEARANVPVSDTVRGQLFGFYDWVHLWNLDTGSTEKSRTLKSVGGGARVTLFNSIALEVTYAHPLDRVLLTPSQLKPPPDRVLLSLTAQLVPFGGRR